MSPSTPNSVWNGVTLAWDDLTVYVKTKKNGKRTYARIISSVTGAVKPGTLIAIMGASGSGKTTLMTTLAYRSSRETSVEGRIMVNGSPIGPYMRHVSGYMYQEDIFVGALTVLEHLHIMANLKLDRSYTREQKLNRVNALMRELGLEKCSNNRICDKTLSGGERKRLSFATELLTDPPLLFCDEPTTGLDAFSAKNLIEIMNTMTIRGKTILCTIHQPSSEVFSMFNQLILLAEGQIAFMGNTSKALEFFEKLGHPCPNSYNPADFLIKVLAVPYEHEQSNKKSLRRICRQYAVSDYCREIDLVMEYEFYFGDEFKALHPVKQTINGPFVWMRLYWLVKRWFMEILRDSSIQTIRIFQKILIALMVGLCYFNTDSYTQLGTQSIQGAVFMLVTENTFSPMYSVLAEFPNNYPVFLREYKSGLYSLNVYYISRILAMIPGLIAEPIIFTIIVYWLTGMRYNLYAFVLSIWITILTMNVSVSCGIFFSNVFNSVPTAMAYIVPFDYILMMTSGLFAKLNVLPSLISWTQYFSWLMYSTESLSILQWSQIDGIKCDEVLKGLPCLTNGTEVLQKYSFYEKNFTRDLWALFLICVSFHILSILFLWKRVRNA